MKEELDKYFFGELSDREKRALLDKVESDEKYRSEFIRMQNELTISKLYTQKGDADWGLKNLKELDRQLKHKQKRHMLWNISKVAAVVAILCINGWLLKDKIISTNDIAYTVIEVPKGQRICMTLTDGTEVWLSPRSVLYIPEKFRKNERLVKLDGEGFFNVARDDKKPFIVQTGDYDIKVLGTSFNVFAYSESERFETDLLKGKIQIYHHAEPEDIMILKPGEKALLENNCLIKSVSQFNNEEYLKNGIFSFSNKPFGEILEYLTLWYDVRFDIKDSVKKELLVSGKFRQSDEVKNILKGLQGVHHFNFKEIAEQNIEIF